MDAGDHGKVILAVILGQGGVKALDFASARVTAEHFEDRVQQVLFTLAQRYADQTRGVLPRHALADMFRSQPPGTSLLYLEYYDLLAAMRPTASDFRHSVGMLRELHQEKLTGEALAQAKEILQHGATDERGNQLRGHADARAHALAAFADIERDSAAGQHPEGDTRKEMARVREAYAKARELRLSGRSIAVGTGIERLDEALSGGLSPGEFAIVFGWTSAGKSQLMAHWAWHAAVEQGKNVVLFTSETTRANMLVRILGRHSKLPKFGLRQGLNTRDIRAGTLSDEEYQAFRTVTEDYATVPGQPYIVQVPRGFTISWLESRLTAIARQFTPELCIIDYLGLARPERNRKDRREELGLILQDTKQLAVTFNDGRGVPVVSPWQVNREGRRAMRERGGYNLSDLSETAEAANAQPLSSQVRTADGMWKAIGELAPGDRLVDPCGEDSRVLGVYRKGVRPVYRVTLADGSSAVACHQHLWEVEGYVGRSVKRRVLTTLELREVVQGRYPNSYRGMRVPAMEPMAFDGTSSLPLDPYLLGVLLSEGSLSDGEGVSFTQDPSSAELLDRVREALPPGHSLKSGCGGRHRISGDGTRKAGSNQVLVALRSLGLAGKKASEKFIPGAYMRADVESRLALLQGIMDGDGCIHVKASNGSRNISFTSASERFRDDVAALVRTLGGRCFTGVSRNVFYTSPTQRIPKRAGDAYKIRSMRLPLNPFYLKRKADLFVSGSAVRHRTVTAVEYLGEEEVACIRVSAASQLYVTDSDIPTHNTPDVVCSLLEPETDETRGRAVPLKLDVLKNRENERYVRIDLMADFACSYFAVRDTAELANPLMDEEED